MSDSDSQREPPKPINTSKARSSRPRPSYSVPVESRPFSRSAAKRSSVLALGSITHLQHQFAKQGNRDQTDRRPPKGGIALPSFATSPTEEASLEEEDESDIPPTPPPPPPVQPKVQFQEVERPASLRELRVECWQQLDGVCERWKLVEYGKLNNPSVLSEASSSPSGSPVIHPPPSPDLKEHRVSSSGSNKGKGSPTPLSDGSAGYMIVDLLQSTTEAIRTVQRFLLMHPDSDASLNSRFSSLGMRSTSNSLDQRHQSQLGVSTAARPRTTISPAQGHNLIGVGRPSQLNPSVAPRDDKISTVKKACLELLGSLKEMEEKNRLPAAAQPEDETTEEGDPSFSDGHLYKDVNFDDLSVEREAVRSWVRQVDELLRASLATQKAGVTTESENQATIRGSPDLSQFSEQLPAWAQPEAFPNDPLNRAHALLVDQIPAELLSNLQAPFGEDGSRERFLESLSDGQLLCLAHNEVLKESSRAWGFIPAEAIHDVIALKRDTNISAEPTDAANAPKVGLTFRRLENLKVWLASLKLRYEIHLGPMIKDKDQQKQPAEAAAVDMRVIARRDAGWEDMLEYSLLRWAERVVQETRDDHRRESMI